MSRIEKIQELVRAEEKAKVLFQELENRNYIRGGISEKELNQSVYKLAFELFGIKKYWHKRIVRAGSNTLLPYRHNPENLTIRENDILFLDFGPVFDEWEADFGRTYVLGSDPKMLKLQQDIEAAWNAGREFYLANSKTITGAEFYAFTRELAGKYGWEFGNEHCGHLIGNFPHEKIQGEELVNYIHPDNQIPMSSKDKNNDDRFWIYEIHFVDEELQIGGFFEQFLN
ncbi:MAG: aminopeptidase P family protein [Bacteroidetes bacterium]|nr:MAG: aminopeptidase P family protein [Bacteroidota bacterium]